MSAGTLTEQEGNWTSGGQLKDGLDFSAGSGSRMTLHEKDCQIRSKKKYWN